MDLLPLVGRIDIVEHTGDRRVTIAQATNLETVPVDIVDSQPVQPDSNFAQRPQFEANSLQKIKPGK